MIGRKKPITSLRSRLARLSVGRVRTAADFGELLVRGHRVIGSPGYPLDETWLREVARRRWDRGGIDPAATRRQGAAIVASGDRRPALTATHIPTLVLHGEADPLIRVAGAQATAAAVPGARLVTFPAWVTTSPASSGRRFSTRSAAWPTGSASRPSHQRTPSDLDSGSQLAVSAGHYPL